MDIGSIVSWVQICLWIVALIVFVGQVVRGEKVIPGWLGKFLASKVLLGCIIFGGLILSVTCYMRFQEDKMHFNKDAKIEQVSDQVFVNEIVDLDGKAFRHCKFTNVKFRYNGLTPISLAESEINGSIRLMSDNGAIESSWVLLKGIGLTPNVPIIRKDGSSYPGVNDPIINPSTQRAP